MDVRVTRRAAEKAARTLINDRAGLVGELGVADAERTRLATDLEAAAGRGRELVAAAEQEAARLVEEAQKDLADGETHYATVRTAATDGGWLTADLTALGYPPTKGRRPHPSVVLSAAPFGLPGQASERVPT